MMQYISIKRICIAVAIVAVVLLGLYCYKRAYDSGYKVGYDAGYTACAESMSVPIQVIKPDTVQASVGVATTTTTTVRPKTKEDTASVVVKTEAPKVTAVVNGKKYDFTPQNQVLETGVSTSASLSIRIPERRWTAGIGYGKDKKVSYMLKAPIGKSSALGVWVAGSGKSNFMGGLSVSF